MRAGFDCPACRVELVHEQLSQLVCPGCGLRYWMRGAEVIREGETEAVAVPDRQVPTARAKIRKRDD